ncbi:MAG TPA: hypothetical protein PKW23_00895 [Dictyoglomaceae bacterium]|nr:hypothetical protein [Dictyoglomaceae bacterium]HOL39081.1 hypothetical protein [Dictyoglomaceae bacterium]HOP94309.1 hypothetical protein [Dictyoglomaceae bacterium]HPP15235.1 hypothetical protein [Dictyoglomaceae bacterium]HPU42642.1 hypothetical protein [Dictyoglomaceae bacterium]
MTLIYVPWFIPLIIISILILQRSLEKRETETYETDAKKFIKIEGSEEVIPPWRREEQKKEENKPKKRGVLFWILNSILILYVLFVWYIAQYQGFNKGIYEIIAGFTISLYFFYLDIPGLLSNIWIYREYPGSIKGEIVMSKHFVLASKKNETKVFLTILFFYYLATFSNFILGGLLALVIKIWMIDRRISKTTLPDW